MSVSELILKSSDNHQKIYHLDNQPNNYILSGKVIKNNSPVIIYKNKPYFSNPVLFEIISQIDRKYANSKTTINQENFPRMTHVKYSDVKNEYSNLIDDVLAIIGIYGSNVVGNLVIARSLFEELLEENIQINQFNDYFKRNFYYECSGDLYGVIDFKQINENVEEVQKKYVFLNVFDLYDNFNNSQLKKITII